MCIEMDESSLGKRKGFDEAGFPKKRLATRDSENEEWWKCWSNGMDPLPASPTSFPRPMMKRARTQKVRFCSTVEVQEMRVEVERRAVAATYNNSDSGESDDSSINNIKNDAMIDDENDSSSSSNSESGMENFRESKTQKPTTIITTSVRYEMTKTVDGPSLEAELFNRLIVAFLEKKVVKDYTDILALFVGSSLTVFQCLARKCSATILGLRASGGRMAILPSTIQLSMVLVPYLEILEKMCNKAVDAAAERMNRMENRTLLRTSSPAGAAAAVVAF